ncbi:hypothetical protein LC605_22635 [Nostoc sp. CHAB 5836]|uniref:hypothetical protein n=1 Tax=Nostoc sp. CHAB 5836 TaxID=2780404 RepID=UPI001E537114|nr:hypothetical protein [Nostoc sp. CHAB 5836]MCC5617833.1 hypothetical protein [Nostoc sp. CHAB 5836]
MSAINVKEDPQLSKVGKIENADPKNIQHTVRYTQLSHEPGATRFCEVGQKKVRSLKTSFGTEKYLLHFTKKREQGRGNS